MSDKRFMDLAYTAEMANLLCQERLVRYQRSNSRFRMLSDSRVYELMCLRYQTLRMRFGLTAFFYPEVAEASRYDLENLIAWYGVKVREFEPTEDNAPDVDSRLSRLTDKLSDAIEETAHAEWQRKQTEKSDAWHYANRHNL